MKPFKTGIPFSKWLLRVTLVIYLILYYHGTLYFLDFLDVSFIFALIYVFSAVALLLGGFKSDSNVTVYSAMILIVAIGFNIYLDVSDGLYGVVNHLLPLGIAFFFLSNGNK